jgi:hypothetical protein
MDKISHYRRLLNRILLHVYNTEFHLSGSHLATVSCIKVNRHDKYVSASNSASCGYRSLLFYKDLKFMFIAASNLKTLKCVCYIFKSSEDCYQCVKS